MYAFSGGTFYRSTDGGATFADTGATGLPAEGVDDFRVAPGKKGHVWLCGRSDKAEVATGLWHSKDGGATWTRIAAIDLAIGVGFGKAAKRKGRTRTSRLSPLDAITLSTLSPGHIDMRTVKSTQTRRISLVCPDCGTWVAVTPHRGTYLLKTVPHHTGKAGVADAIRCTSSNRLVDVDITDYTDGSTHRCQFQITDPYSK